MRGRDLVEDEMTGDKSQGKRQKAKSASDIVGSGEGNVTVLNEI